jgi:ATP-dependent DNA helicase RecG
VSTTLEELRGHPLLAGRRIEPLHGKMSAEEKDATMRAFAAGDIDVLVATTVIEVGVDVPNATVMVILDADRFGIAQLHQLRGRVGRGAGLASTCVLVGAGATPDAEERLQAMVNTQDGFVLAEVDLDIRGEGTIMGERQKGRNDLKLASLRRDREWVSRAREVEVELVDADPVLTEHAQLLAEVEAFLDDEDREFLLKG